MSPVVEQLKPTLDALSVDDRNEVIRYLFDLDKSGDELTQEEWESALVAECDRRMADYKAGKTTARPVEEFMAEMREKYG